MQSGSFGVLDSANCQGRSVHINPQLLDKIEVRHKSARRSDIVNLCRGCLREKGQEVACYQARTCHCSRQDVQRPMMSSWRRFFSPQGLLERLRAR